MPAHGSLAHQLLAHEAPRHELALGPAAGDRARDSKEGSDLVAQDPPRPTVRGRRVGLGRARVHSRTLERRHPARNADPAYVRAPSSVPRARLRSSSLLARRRAIDPRGECARGPARIGSCTLCACVWSCHQCLDGERYRSGITPPPVAPDRAVSAPGAPSRGRPPTRDSAQGDTSVPPPLDHSLPASPTLTRLRMSPCPRLSVRYCCDC